MSSDYIYCVDNVFYRKGIIQKPVIVEDNNYDDSNGNYKYISQGTISPEDFKTNKYYYKDETDLHYYPAIAFSADTTYYLKNIN